MDRPVLIALLCAGLAAACRFAPQIGDGTVRCGVADACPPGFACASDGTCRRGAAVNDLSTVDAVAPSEDLAAADLSGADLSGVDLASPPDLACIKAVCPGNGCGRMLDGCGGVLDCGSKTCSGGKVCGAKQRNQCGPGNCTPIANCGAVGKNCGLISNDCDDVIDCGTCASGSCGGGGVANVCG
jgi:hypothetical protein